MGHEQGFPDKEMIHLVDTHCHLIDPSFDIDLDQVLERALKAGVGPMIVMSEDEGEAQRALALCARHPSRLFPAIGLFPGRGGIKEAESLADMARRERDRIVSIGEVGLDYRITQDEGERKIQREVLALLVDLSLELDLPMSVHCRSAGKKTLEFLMERNARKVVMHAFDGKAGHAMEAAEHGFFFSIPPTLVRSRQKEKLVGILPLESMLLESDAPVMGPVPGKRNEPAMLSVTLERISEIKGVDPFMVVEKTWENAKTLFGPLT